MAIHRRTRNCVGASRWRHDGGTPKPPTDTPPSLLREFVEWGKAISFETLPENSVVTVKIGLDDPNYANRMQFNIIKQVLEPRAEILKSKKIAILFMSASDEISSFTPEEMEQAGWTRKDKSLIINPFNK